MPKPSSAAVPLEIVQLLDGLPPERAKAILKFALENKDAFLDLLMQRAYPALCVSRQPDMSKAPAWATLILTKWTSAEQVFATITRSGQLVGGELMEGGSFSNRYDANEWKIEPISRNA